jgi:hypothetical protein
MLVCRDITLVLSRVRTPVVVRRLNAQSAMTWRQFDVVRRKRSSLSNHLLFEQWKCARCSAVEAWLNDVNERDGSSR